MITDPTGEIALSSIGYIDGGSLWLCGEDLNSRNIELSDANHLRIRNQSGPYFSAVHHWNERTFSVTIQTYDEPQRVLARLVLVEGGLRVEGDTDLWEKAPGAYVGYVGSDIAAPNSSGYFVIRVEDGRPEIISLDFFNNGNYTRMYHSIISGELVPGGGWMIFGVVRTTALVLADRSGRELKRVPMADRGGNAEPYLSRFQPVLWAVDRDTIVRVDRESWSVNKACRLEGNGGGRGPYVGRLWVSPAETEILVPRPYSGDVLVLDPADLSTVEELSLSGPPIEAAAVAGGRRVVAREWKTGSLLVADRSKAA